MYHRHTLPEHSSLLSRQQPHAILYGYVGQPTSASEMHPHTNAAEEIGLVMKTPEHPSTQLYVPLHSHLPETLQDAKGYPSTQLSPASILSIQSFFP